jgi:hypothetical protein
VVDYSSPSTVYASTNNGVFKSVDGAASWTALEIPASSGTRRDYQALAIDPVTPTTLYAGGVLPSHVYKTIDGGATWTPTGTFPTLNETYVNAVLVDPAAPSTVYVSAGDGLYKSIDGGASWALAGLGGLGSGGRGVMGLALSPGPVPTLIASKATASGRWAYTSQDGGATWTDHSGGLPNVAVYALAYGPTGDLYAGTLGRGVYVLPGPAVTSVSPVQGPLAGGTAVTVTGNAFMPGATLWLGGVAATGVSVVNETTITGTVPAHTAGAVSVLVQNPTGQAGTLTGGFTYKAVVTLAPLTQPLHVGGTNTLAGSGFSPGSVVKLFVATAAGTFAHGPFVPSAVGASSLTWVIPADVPLGNGFGAVQVINTDQGYAESNVVTALLDGDAAIGIPTILTIDGATLGPADPSIGVAHIDTVVAKGATTTIGGTGFADPLVNLFTAAGNVGPLVPLAGGTATQGRVVVPAGAPTGPGNFQVVNRPSYRASNAVASIVGAVPTVTHVGVSGGTITVTGTGFSTLSVINLYNLQGGGVVNLGGLGASGARIPLTIVSDTQFTFARPAGAAAGPAFVEVLNPPFIPFSSSGNDPDGAFTMP